MTEDEKKTLAQALAAQAGRLVVPNSGWRDPADPQEPVPATDHLDRFRFMMDGEGSDDDQVIAEMREASEAAVHRFGRLVAARNRRDEEHIEGQLAEAMLEVDREFRGLCPRVEGAGLSWSAARGDVNFALKGEAFDQGPRFEPLEGPFMRDAPPTTARLLPRRFFWHATCRFRRADGEWFQIISEGSPEARLAVRHLSQRLQSLEQVPFGPELRDLLLGDPATFPLVATEATATKGEQVLLAVVNTLTWSEATFPEGHQPGDRLVLDHERFKGAVIAAHEHGELPLHIIDLVARHMAANGFAVVASGPRDGCLVGMLDDDADEG